MNIDNIALLVKDEKDIVDATVQGVMQQLQGAICESMAQIRGDTAGPSSQATITIQLTRTRRIDRQITISSVAAWIGSKARKMIVHTGPGDCLLRW